MTNDFPPAFARQYDSHLKHLKLKGLQPKTIDAYARAIRRLGGYFDYRIETLSEAQLTEYFSDLIGTHSWSAVKLDLYGLKFFTLHVLKRAWAMPNLIKPPKTQRLPDIVTVDEAQPKEGVMKKFMTSFAALAAGFSAQYAEAMPTQQEIGQVTPSVEASMPGHAASSQITVTNKAGDAFGFTLDRAGTGLLMAYHHSRSNQFAGAECRDRGCACRGNGTRICRGCRRSTQACRAGQCSHTGNLGKYWWHD